MSVEVHAQYVGSYSGFLTSISYYKFESESQKLPTINKMHGSIGVGQYADHVVDQRDVCALQKCCIIIIV